MGCQLAPLVDAFLQQHTSLTGARIANEVIASMLIQMMTTFVWAHFDVDPMHFIQRVAEEWQRITKEHEQTQRFMAANRVLLEHLEATGRIESV